MKLIQKPLEFDSMLKLISTDPVNCFYIYMNAIKYGLSSQFIKFYVDDVQKPSTILMNYHNTCQVYSVSEKLCDESLLSSIIRINPTIITGNESIIRKIEPLIQNLYNCSYGYTYEISSFPILKYSDIVIPSDDELERCAKLICQDETIGSYYDFKSLYEQLVSRRNDGYGRNYIIKKNSRIIAHIATYAENTNFASTAGLIVDPEYRDKPYGSYLESYLVNELLSENKRVISFLREHKRVKFYNSLGVGTYTLNGKLVRKGL